MPYITKKVKGGYKVCKRNNPSKCFSKKPLTKTTARKQEIAMRINESESFDQFVNRILSELL